MKKLLLTLAAGIFALGAMAETVTYQTADATNISGTDIPERPAGTTSATDQGEARHIQPLEGLNFGDFAFTFDANGGATAPSYYYPMSTSTTGKPTIRLYVSNTMTITAPEGATMTKLVVKGSNGKKVNEMTASEGTIGGVDGAALTATASNWQWDGETNAVTFTYAGTYRINSIEITYSEGTVTPASEAPVFTPEGQEFQGSISVAIAAAGAIYYTTDGTNPTTESTAYTAPLTITETTTVKAIAVESGKRPSPVVSQTYTKEVAYGALDALIEAGLANTSNAVKYSGNATVVYQSGKYLYLEDETDVLLAYGTLTQNYTPGDVITGFSGKMTVYNGLKELNVDAASFVAPVAHIAAPEPLNVAINDITADDMNKYVRINSVTLKATTSGTKTNYTLEDAAGASVICYSRFADVTFPTADNAYDVIGLVSVYNNDIQIYPTEFLQTSGVEGIVADENAPVEYFNLQGMPVANPQGGIFIRRQGATVVKVAL